MRTTVDIPDEVYRQLKVEAARLGSSVRSLIVDAVSQNLHSPARRVRVKFPLIGGEKGKIVNPTDEQIEEAMLG